MGLLKLYLNTNDDSFQMILLKTDEGFGHIARFTRNATPKNKNYLDAS